MSRTNLSQLFNQYSSVVSVFKNICDEKVRLISEIDDPREQYELFDQLEDELKFKMKRELEKQLHNSSIKKADASKLIQELSSSSDDSHEQDEDGDEDDDDFTNVS